MALKSSANKRDRYNKADEEDIIEVNSDCEGGEMKCIVPTAGSRYLNSSGKKKHVSYSLNKN